MFEELDERDTDLDTEDTDLEDENSGDVEDTEDDAADKKGNEEKDSEDDEADEKDSEEDDDKPVTKGELKRLLKGNQNQNNAKRRVSSKGRDTNPPPKANDRLDRVERTLQHTALLEKKRDFGYKNNLSPDEVDVVFRLTSRPTSKFLQEPQVKGAIEGLRAHRNVRNNTPGSTGQTFKTSVGKDWKDLKDDEKQANFADRRRSILESKRK